MSGGRGDGAGSQHTPLQGHTLGQLILVVNVTYLGKGNLCGGTVYQINLWVCLVGHFPDC